MDVQGAHEDRQSTAATVVVGLLVGLVLAALLLGAWHVTRPAEPGLRWGNEIYTSEDQFKTYLRSKGLSYTTWVARHPGAAPWDR